MTGLLSQRYFENGDISVLAINEYNKSPADRYPTFSICFEGTQFVWIHDIRLFDAYGLNATQYRLMLEGEIAMKYELNYSSSLYDKATVLPSDKVKIMQQNH